MYFTNISNLDDLRKVYHKLCLKLHPDLGGSEQEMADLNNEFSIKFEELKKAPAYKATHSTEVPAEFIDIVNKLIHLEGLKVELCGRWLWISGDTYKHKDALKAAGCKWASKKGMWSWHHAEDGEKRSRGNKPMNDIRLKYGSEVFTPSPLLN